LLTRAANALLTAALLHIYEVTPEEFRYKIYRDHSHGTMNPQLRRPMFPVDANELGSLGEIINDMDVTTRNDAQYVIDVDASDDDDADSEDSDMDTSV